MPTFYNCSCFISRNIYIKQYNMHVSFVSDSQFLKEYGEFLRKTFKSTCEEMEQILAQIHQEVERRRARATEASIRKAQIRHDYIRMIPAVYELKESYFSDLFLTVAKYCGQQKDVRSRMAAMDHVLEEGIIREEAVGIYTLDVFTPNYCREITLELEHFISSSMPKERPNSMNHHGILVQELGFDEGCLDVLRQKYLQPIVDCLFPEFRGAVLDSHKAFTVHYSEGRDLDLGMHFDNSEVTLNICLSGQFEGSTLCFCGPESISGVFTNGGDKKCRTELQIVHRPGVGVLHKGSQLHRVEPLISGNRSNLVVWMRSSNLRNSRCPMCNAAPQLEPGEGYADGFTAADALLSSAIEGI